MITWINSNEPQEEFEGSNLDGIDIQSIVSNH